MQAMLVGPCLRGFSQGVLSGRVVGNHVLRGFKATEDVRNWGGQCNWGINRS
ncbi:hypothetical protein L1049_025566 [Liquidambar formosana]|uniref:Uncharacterized protein n=1 Tax=Liquidambar formosana TaxID=63359 RepID=A0AAP0NC29_LIQFO